MPKRWLVALPFGLPARSLLSFLQMLLLLDVPLFQLLRLSLVLLL